MGVLGAENEESTVEAKTGRTKCSTAETQVLCKMTDCANNSRTAHLRLHDGLHEGSQQLLQRGRNLPGLLPGVAAGGLAALWRQQVLRRRARVLTRRRVRQRGTAQQRMPDGSVTAHDIKPGRPRAWATVREA